MRKIDLKQVEFEFSTYIGNVGELTLDDIAILSGIVDLRAHDGQTPGGLQISGTGGTTGPTGPLGPAGASVTTFPYLASNVPAAAPNPMHASIKDMPLGAGAPSVADLSLIHI